MPPLPPPGDCATLQEGKDLQVLAQLEDCKPEEVRIGMPLTLTTGKIKTDLSTGKDVIAYKYRPARDEHRVLQKRELKE